MARKGSKLSDETKRKMSEAQQRLAKDPEIRAMRSKNAKLVEARKREEEAADPELAEERAAIRSDAVKRGWVNRSREVSEETRKRLSEAGKGRVTSDKTKRILSVKKKYGYYTEEFEEWLKVNEDSTPGIIKHLKCRACGDKFGRALIVYFDGFCQDCITHTTICKCGCREEIFRYTKEGHVRKVKDLGHNAKVITRIRRSYDGSGNPAWKGGTTFEPYDENFNDKRKEEIRTRENYRCADEDDTCNYHETQLCVHHIDEDKKNSEPMNLIALCSSHHGRAHNEKARTRHKEYIKSIYN